MVAVRSDLIIQEIALESHAEITTAEITVSNGPPLVVASVYRPPKHGDVANNYTNNLTTDLYELSDKYHENTIWVSGDTNLPDIDWENGAIMVFSYLHSLNDKFHQCTLDVGFEQTVGLLTYDDTFLNVFLTN